MYSYIWNPVEGFPPRLAATRLFHQQLAGASGFEDFQREHQLVRELLSRNPPGSIDIESLAKEFSFPSSLVAVVSFMVLFLS